MSYGFISATDRRTQALPRSSSPWSSQSPNGWVTQVAPRCVIGQSVAWSATAPPHGISRCWDGEGTIISSPWRSRGRAPRRAGSPGGRPTSSCGSPGGSSMAHWISAYGISAVNPPCGLQRVDRRQRVTHLGLGPGVHADQADHAVVLEVLGHERLRRSGQVRDTAAELRRRAGLDQVAVRPRDLGAGLGRPQEQGERRRGQRVEPEHEPGRDAEVAAPAMQRPEQLAVLVLVGRHDAAVGGDELDLEQVVARESPLPLEPAGATAQRQAGDTGRRDAAARGGQPVRLRGPVEGAPGRAAGRPWPFSRRGRPRRCSCGACR